MELKNILLLGALSSLISFSGFAQHKYVQSDGEAPFEGYDLVSYFNGSQPIPGIEKYQTQYDGLTLYFANMANLQEFKRRPTDYMPAYGGSCATAVSNKDGYQKD